MMTKSLRTSLALFVFLAPLACASTSIESPPASPQAPASLDAGAVSLAKRGNLFAVDMLHTLDRDHNLAFSPASLSAALAMTYAGARAETADEIRRAMHFDADAPEVARSYAALLATWKSEN